MSSDFPKEARSTSPRLVDRTAICAGARKREFAFALALFALTTLAFPAVEVRTLGGGRGTATGLDYGFFDGNMLEVSQFHTPVGAAVDAAGQVYIADRDNGAIRKLDLANNRSSTVVSGLDQPLAVAIAGPNDLYVLTKGDGLVTRFDRSGTPSVVASGLSSPTAMTLDANMNLFLTEERGTVVHVPAGGGSPRLVATGLNRPNGIAALDSGLLVVSDTGNNRVCFINRDNGQTVQQIGTGEAGFRDGAASTAKFNQPQQIAKTPSGNIVVADRFNHRVRLIDFDGAVSTIYGVDPSAWEGPACLDCEPIILPGWLDGTADFAEAREPVGVAVSRDGKLYATEVYYHLVREITGITFSAAAGVTDTNLVVLSPTIYPSSGFFPLGQAITVVNPNPTTFLPSSIYYTTDGSEPTTNSFSLALTGNSGTIFWSSPTRDLTSLRLKAYVGSQASIEVSGTPSPVSEIGVPRDIVAGMGSTVVLPVVVNLRTDDPLKSLQFRVEVTPASPNAPMISPTFSAMSISTNDFIRVATSDKDDSASSTNKTFFNVADYVLGDARGLVVTMIGTNANFSAKNFAVVAMLSVPIPAGAKPGESYQIDVVNPSGTSDGIQSAVPLTPMPPRFITIQNISYEVGDTARAIWYNSDTAGLGFGDGTIDNADVNNAFSASLGVRVPHEFSDLFDAMDAFPQDTMDTAGGDGLIRFLDWQIILQRSLGLDQSRWIRTWSEGGVRVARSIAPTSDRGLRSTKATLVESLAPGAVWYRQASIKAISIEAVRPGLPVDVPVYLSVAPGERLAGLAFRATVHGEGTAPALFEPMHFIAGPNIPNPIQSVGQSSGDLLCGWSLVPSPAFAPALQGTTLLGYLRVTLPARAAQDHSYTVRFQNADGAPDLQSQYDLETIPGSLWVLTPAAKPAETISDEWKLHFFGSVDGQNTPADADPDGDGNSNQLEYQAGTDPVNKSSCLHLGAPAWDSARNAFVLRWLSAPGKIYSLESSSDLAGAKWDLPATNLFGNGFVQEFPITNDTHGSRFYRLRLQH